MHRTPRHLAAAALLWTAALVPAPAAAQRPAAVQGTVVIVHGAEASLPVPLVGSGTANRDVASLLYLRLMTLGRDLMTSGDRGFEAALATAVTRRDSVTLVFDLDARARWHDGRPVTSRDVVFTFAIARDPKVAPQLALLLRRVASVDAEGDHRVVFRFSEVYGEQVYDAVWHVQPLPAHLVESIPPDQLAASEYAQRPIGNGPYRFVRRDAGRQVELVSVPGHFLGNPRLTRVVFLLARDPEAQINLILDGTADILENITPATNISRVENRQEYRVVPVPTFTVGYLLFNQHAPGDRSAPHPILSDAEVRRALAMALDRDAMIRATFGAWSAVAEGPVAQLHWIREPGVRAVRHDPAEARRRLEARGWRDTNGDGVLDRNGAPLRLRLNYPGTSAARGHLAQQAQEQLRRIGVDLELMRLDGPVWYERRTKGEFDIDFSAASMDPSPAGLVQSWSCGGRGGSNVAGYCNPVVDSLMEVAIRKSGDDARRAWWQVVRGINADAPAIFLYAPANAAAMHNRFTDVFVAPELLWSRLYLWGVTPGQQIARDRSP